MTTSTSAQPFADTAEQYREAGWDGVLPLPARAKTPPPPGMTGRDGRWPTADEVAAWVESHADGNIALRLPEDVIGLDVDNYDCKPGAATLTDRVRRWGALPPTVTSTSRDDGDSGIRFYRVPAGLDWPNVLGDGVDIVRHSHRYAVAAPSLHPSGKRYRWLDADGAEVEIPCPADLPELPPAWVEELSRAAAEPAPAAEVAAFIAGLTPGEPSDDVRELLRRFESALDEGRKETLAAVEALAVAGAGGARGVREGLELARATYCAVKGESRGDDFDRQLAGSVGRIRSGAVDVYPRADVLAFVTESENEAETFWDERPRLRHVHDFARARLASPWAVLGVVLARVVAATPPYVVLPPTVGSHASLNLFTALTGPSGSGKGAAERGAADAVDFGDIEVATVGSGEGIGHLYGHREKGELVRDRDAVLFTIPEVDNLTALGNRQGATLMPQLRSAWSGEKLGFSYADKGKSIPIEAHTYRMGLVLGVQPGRAEPLLDDADGGTPQRFLWLPTLDPTAPDVPMPEPPPLKWRSPNWRMQRMGGDLAVMGIPECAADTIRRARLARLRGSGDALDGHALLARLKVAAALALLEQRTEVTEDDWRLAGTVLTVSDAARGDVVRFLSKRASESNEARGKAEAARAVAVDSERDRAAIARVAKSLRAALEKSPGEWTAHAALRRALPSRTRSLADEALLDMETAGVIEVQHGEHNGRPSKRYRLVG